MAIAVELKWQTNLTYFYKKFQRKMVNYIIIYSKGKVRILQNCKILYIENNEIKNMVKWG